MMRAIDAPLKIQSKARRLKESCIALYAGNVAKMQYIREINAFSSYRQFYCASVFACSIDDVLENYNVFLYNTIRDSFTPMQRVENLI